MTEDIPTMQPAQPTRLRWLAPRRAPAAAFAALRPSLDRLLALAHDDEVYTVNTRSIYRYTDPDLGPVAIKEIRFENQIQRCRAATVRRHRTLCEFRVASGFEARGGKTPKLFGGALELSRFGWSRHFIVSRWLDGAHTLSQAFKHWGDPPPDTLLERLAVELVSAARIGLVHGRHSSENILVTDLNGTAEFSVIDFSHAQLRKQFAATGFARDVARIGSRLIHERACDQATVMALFDVVARTAWPEPARWRQAIEREFAHILKISKQRQRLERKSRTFLRGLPSRV